MCVVDPCVYVCINFVRVYCISASIDGHILDLKRITTIIIMSFPYISSFSICQQ